MGFDSLAFKVRAVTTALKEQEQQAHKTREAVDPNAKNVETLRSYGPSVGGYGPTFDAILDNLQKLILINEKAWREGTASTHDLSQLASYIQKDVDFIKTWGGTAGQNFNFDAFKRAILEGAGQEAEKAVGRVVEREKRLARSGTGGFSFGAPMPTKPADTPAQVSTGQVRG